MALMQKIRTNAGLLILTIGIAMVAFILTDMFRGLTGASDPRVIGEVYGEDVMYDDFYELYQQNLSNQQVDTDDQRREIAQSTWDGYVNQLIFGKEYASSGVEVSGDELYNLFINPPQGSVIPTIPAFQDSLGRFNPAYVRQALGFLELGPDEIQSQEQANFIAFIRSLEDYLYQNRLRDKYFGALKASAFTSTNEIRRNYMNENRKFDISFVSVNYNVVPDSTINVSDDDMRNYLSEHKEEFRQEENTEIRYAKFTKTPSSEDSTSALASLEKTLKAWREVDGDTTTNDTAFLISTGGYWDTTFIAPNAFSPALGKIAENPKVGEYYGPVVEDGAFRAYKVMGTRKSDKGFAKLRHIQLPYKGFSKEDTLATRDRARELRSETTDENFAIKANQYSMDNNTALTGGYLGWVSATSGFGKDFDDAVNGADAGDMVIAKSPRGYHIIHVMAKSDEVYDLASIEKEIFAGTQTLRALYQEASRFAGKVFQFQDIDKAASEVEGLNSAVANLNKNTLTIPGLLGSRSVVNWAMGQEEGAISEEILETDNAYVVAMVTEKSAKGYKTLDQVRDQIRGPVLNELKAEQIKAKLSGISSTNLEEIASQYGPGAFTSKASAVNFASSSIPSIGSDQKVIGTITTLQQNQVSEPIQGVSAVYVIRVDAITEAPEMQEADIELRKQTAAFQNRSNLENKAFQALREIADVKDYRYKFDL